MSSLWCFLTAARGNEDSPPPPAKMTFRTQTDNIAMPQKKSSFEITQLKTLAAPDSTHQGQLAP